MAQSGCDQASMSTPLGMKMRLLLSLLVLLSPGLLRAQTTTTTETETSTTASGPIGAPQGTSAQQAFDVAKDGVAAELRGRVVSIYGTGSPAGIDTWWVIFYDPSSASHGHAVRVQNGQIVRSYEAKGGVIYGDTLTFAPNQIRGANKALRAAEDYASQHSLAYDHVRALLRLTTHDQNLRWRVQLLDGGVSKGFVFVDASSGALAHYEPSTRHHESSGDGDSVSANAHAAGNDIKNTFLGIGGDLQQFFTGERTVDQ
jgi:hypothetical protein